jgi:hypothetical protein
MRKLLLGLVVTTTALTFLSAVSMKASASSSLTATVVRHVSPLDATGQLKPSYTVGNERNGHCFTTSFENGRLFRCIGGNFIHDPCWKEAGVHSVVCLGTPQSHRVVRLDLTRRLPDTDNFGPRLWGLRLANGIGVNCQASQGATGTVHGKPLSYFCRHGWALLGNHPNRSQPVWTMDTAKRVHGTYHERGRKNLSVAWRAVKL